MTNGLENALRELSSRGRPYGPERVYRLAVERGHRLDRRRKVASVALLVGVLVVAAIAVRSIGDSNDSNGIVLQSAGTTTGPTATAPPTVLASADVAGRRWEFVSREDGFYGRCLEVRGPSGKGMVGGCGVSTPFAGHPAPLSGGLRFDDVFYAIYAGTVPNDVDRIRLTLRNGRIVDAPVANGAWLAVIPASQLTQDLNNDDPGLIVARAEAYAGDTKRWTYLP